MTDKEYAADCIKFLREMADRIRDTQGDVLFFEADADKLDEIAAALQIDTQET